MFARNRGDVALPVEVAAPEAQPVVRGAVGLGTWRTQAEFRDARVTQGGRELLASGFESGAAGWHPVRGAWQAEGGVYRQSAEAEDVRSVAGDPTWTDYTFS